jgi:hypothetical protein
MRSWISAASIVSSRSERANQAWRKLLAPEAAVRLLGHKGSRRDWRHATECDSEAGLDDIVLPVESVVERR